MAEIRMRFRFCCITGEIPAGTFSYYTEEPAEMQFRTGKKTSELPARTFSSQIVPLRREGSVDIAELPVEVREVRGIEVALDIRDIVGR